MPITKNNSPVITRFFSCNRTLSHSAIDGLGLKLRLVLSPKRKTPAPDRHRRQLSLFGFSYAFAAAAAFFAALAAFAAVEAFRRLLVLGGVAGASPINSAVIMLVTNSFGP